MHTSKEIRQSFIDFFQDKGHCFVASSPVVPIDDKTLLFTNAGMNQFKNIFLGNSEPSCLRAVNSQKCIRAGGKHNDLEAVGNDGYHHTFFEMLGNWSFGDYYKREAIAWAWELLTGIWKLPKDKLHATAHHTDAEAFELWKQETDIDPSHITYHGDKDNFWEMGESGPCGPCSEIHFDRGAEFCSNLSEGHVCAVNGDCERYIELWNLVFIQFFRNEKGELNPLPKKYVDTGAGFERLCQVLQGKESNYDTDLFTPLLDKISKLSGKEYTGENGLSHRVIADHIRCLCFALADGGFPSNEGRGYVLRRILRRAARHGRLLGFLEPFLWKLVDCVIEVMGDFFTELKGREAYIKMVIKAEEDRFNHTLDKGLEKFNEITGRLEQDKSIPRIIPGSDAFLLYDTYGFPLDLTTLLAEEKDYEIDLDGFDQEMQAQRERARSASKFGFESRDIDWIEFSEIAPTEFVGYDRNACKARIQRYALNAGAEVHIQMDQTPFYAEAGGQVSDTGFIEGDAFKIRILKVIKIEDYFIHIGQIVEGLIDYAEVLASIDLERRQNIKRNHTATHLLHKVLRDLLGDHVQQKGSLVEEGYFRFDFTHLSAMSPDQIRKVEYSVNEQIRNNLTVKVNLSTLEQARQEGATALFGEKYKDTVRVVEVDGFSKELCGGTHVSATGEIGLLKITSESSIAAGIRRIEGLTGFGAERYLFELEDSMAHLAKQLGCPVQQIQAKTMSLQNQITELESEIKTMVAAQLSTFVNQLIPKAITTGEYALIIEQVELADNDSNRILGDILKDKTRNMIALIFSKVGDKHSLICVVSQDLLPKYHAGKIVSKIASMLDGKGGGRPDFAMAGVKDFSRFEEIKSQIPDLIKSCFQ